MLTMDLNMFLKLKRYFDRGEKTFFDDNLKKTKNNLNKRVDKIFKITLITMN